jgi:hypothetical protein
MSRSLFVAVFVVISGAAVGPARAAGPSYAVDAMVGQVNGEAIYADEVLEPIDEQLRALSQELPRGEFIQRASRLVAGRVRQIVADALILGEAQRSLTEQQVRRLRVIMHNEREKVLREYGRGSLAVAERRLREEKGLSLDAFLEERRQEIIVSQFLRTELMPKINVSRKDIERYYRENIDRYAPPPTRDIRVYISDSREAALELRRALADDAVALRALLEDPAAGVRDMTMDDAAGDEVFAADAANAALVELAEGEASEPVEVNDQHWVIHVTGIEQPRPRSLRDAQIEIDRRLRAQAFQVRVERYRRELFDRGSFNPLREMASAVMEVVVGRYAPAVVADASGRDSEPALDDNR